MSPKTATVHLSLSFAMTAPADFLASEMSKAMVVPWSFYSASTFGMMAIPGLTWRALHCRSSVAAQQFVGLRFALSLVCRGVGNYSVGNFCSLICQFDCVHAVGSRPGEFLATSFHARRGHVAGSMLVTPPSPQVATERKAMRTGIGSFDALDNSGARPKYT